LYNGLERGDFIIISYPESDDLLFDKTDIDLIIQQYSTLNNERAIKRIIKIERAARKGNE